MNSGKLLLIFLLIIYVLIISIFNIKSKRPVLAMLFTALQGVCALFAVNLIGEYITVHIPVNAYTLGVGAVGGIPSVIMLLLCDIFMK